MRVCIVSDSAFGDRVFEQCTARFLTDFVRVGPLAETAVDDVTIDVPEADLYVSFLRSPVLTLALVEQGRPVILAVSFGPGFVRQAKVLNPDVVAPVTLYSLEPTTWNDQFNGFTGIFGLPRFAVEIRAGRFVRVRVLRGSPCGSTAAVAAELLGQPLKPATFRHFGLRICHHCRASRPGRPSDLATAGLIHIRELLHALPADVINTEMAVFNTECDRLFGELVGGHP